MGATGLSCLDVTMHVRRGVAMAVSVTGMDAALIAASHLLVPQSIFQLPSKDTWLEALSTHGSHLLAVLRRFMLAFPSFLHAVLGTVFPGLLLSWGPISVCFTPPC